MMKNQPSSYSNKCSLSEHYLKPVRMMEKKVMKNKILFLVIPLMILALIVGFAVRYALALHQVRQSNQAISEFSLADIGSTDSLSIIPLFEAWSKSDAFSGGHGLSYLLKTDNATILLDLGNNEGRSDPSPLQRNMQTLGISFSDIDAVVISHNHPDHVGGSYWWRRQAFAADNRQQSLSGMKIYLPEKLKHPQTDTVIAKMPAVIAPGVISLGAQPFIEPFPLGMLEPLGWEQVLAINVKDKGVVLIMGCGHPTLETVVERAEAIFDVPVVGVVGGFHYLNASSDELTPHIDFLRQRKPVLVALSPHDSRGSVLQAFEAAFSDAYRYIVTGHEIVMP
jgi:7,8-dihydropterin-6-yl-methyl-4-(beta-D-ribofuranosyl)aminobenzene 5'-phosphate synthase